MKRIVRWALVVGLVLGAAGAEAKRRTVKVSPPAEVGPNTPLALGKGTIRVALNLDAATGELTARFLEGSSDEHVRVVQEKVRVTGIIQGKKFVALLDAADDPDTGEKKWDTSIFRGRSGDLVGAHEVNGTIFFMRVKGINYSNVRFHYKDASADDASVPSAAGTEEGK